MRQMFLDAYVPKIWELGLTIPDPNLRKNPETGRWEYSDPDWDEFLARHQRQWSMQPRALSRAPNGRRARSMGAPCFAQAGPSVCGTALLSCHGSAGASDHPLA
jgi:hypothetical protein